MASVNFSPNAIQKLKDNNLTEADAIDVFNNGEYKKNPNGANVATKKYPSYGYEIGLYYKTDSSGGYTITTVWKRERR